MGLGPAAGYSSNCSQYYILCHKRVDRWVWGQQQVTAVTIASIIYCVTRASIIYCVTREYFQAVMSLAMMTEALARN